MNGGLTNEMPKPLNREDMKAVLARGESVMYKGRIIIHEHLLPSDAELAVGDPVKEAQAAQDLSTQINKLQQTLDDLTSGRFKSQPAAGHPETAVPPVQATPQAQAMPAPGPRPAVTRPLTPEEIEEEKKAAQRKALVADIPPEQITAEGHAPEGTPQGQAKKGQGKPQG